MSNHLTPYVSDRGLRYMPPLEPYQPPRPSGCGLQGPGRVTVHESSNANAATARLPSRSRRRDMTTFYICPDCRSFWSPEPMPTDPPLRVNGGACRCRDCSREQARHDDERADARDLY